MTAALSGKQTASIIGAQFPGSVISFSENSIEAKPESLLEVARFLKAQPDFAFDYLSAVTGVDYLGYFEVIYQLVSIKHNHGLLLRTRCYDRKEPRLPSLTPVWQGADYQEREIYDLFGITFDGHPNMKHIVLWEGFRGNPLRKDFIEW